MYFDETGLEWQNPSPNIRSLTAAILYPGTCLLEGRQVSVGRGTDAPFQLLGAPWWKGREMAAYLNALKLPGVSFVPRRFTPTESTYKGQEVEGLEVQVLDRNKIDSVRVGLEIVAAAIKLYPGKFDVKQTLRLLGSDYAAARLERGESGTAVNQSIQGDLAAFKKMRQAYLLYDWKVPQRAIIIGGGPAGLTAAYELLKRTEIHPVVLEKSDILGGISRTVNYKGNRIDIGGHRFFSKSDRVMEWWLEIMPLQHSRNAEEEITYQGRTRTIRSSDQGPDPDRVDEVMLVRGRKSRIYFLRRFFEYPITLSVETLRNLGLWRTIRIGISYLLTVLFPIRNEKNLEEFFINRFGRELYLTFFKSYTEKVWGVACREISAEWGAQRIKGLSITRTLLHMAKKLFGKRGGDLSQKGTETSLIEKFLYPKLGPGQMWEEVSRKIIAQGGEIVMNQDVESVVVKDGRVSAVRTKAGTYEGDYFFSTMPVQELIRKLEGVAIPAEVREVSDGLMYRDFITVGLLLRKLKLEGSLIRDNWIYIQEPDVLAGRLQIFNNWSPYLLDKQDQVWVGVEYFCYEGDPLWTKPDEEMKAFAVAELERIGMIEKNAVLDATVIRMPKTYPAYFGSYDRFDKIREFTDRLDNLFLVGRNGMHKYNNQDHSMLTAMTAVDNIVAGRADKENIWATNTEQEYHESK